MTRGEAEKSTEEPVVYVIDDDPAVRQSVRWLMESVGRQVEDFASADTFLEHYAPERAGCLLTDVRMPGIGGVQLQELLGERGITIPVIVMTAYGDVSTAVRAMKAGALDFIEKPYNEQQLLDLVDRAITQALAAQALESEQEAVRAKYRNLTRREAQVMALVVKGNTNKQIAFDLGISEKTVEAHRSRVMEKMGVNSIAELVTIAPLCLSDD